MDFDIVEVDAIIVRQVQRAGVVALMHLIGDFLDAIDRANLMQVRDHRVGLAARAGQAKPNRAHAKLLQGRSSTDASRTGERVTASLPSESAAKLRLLGAGRI